MANGILTADGLTGIQGQWPPENGKLFSPKNILDLIKWFGPVAILCWYVWHSETSKVTAQKDTQATVNLLYTEIKEMRKENKDYNKETNDLLRQLITEIKPRRR
jgi:hypothetical protein